MFNLMKSVRYSLVRSKVYIITLLSVIGMAFLLVHGNISDPADLKKITGEAYFSGFMGDMYIMSIIAMLILSSVICGADAGDKTLNYELMDGHSRNSIFVSRILCNLWWSGGMVTLLMCFPFVLFSCVNGVGKSAVLRDMVLRYVLSLFPTFRLIMFFGMLAIVLRGAARGGALSYACLMVTIILEVFLSFQELGDGINYLFGFQNGAFLFKYNNARSMVVEGEQMMVTDYSLYPNLVGMTCLVSLLLGALYLCISYIVFIRSDRD